MFKIRLALILSMLLIPTFSYASIDDGVRWLYEHQNSDYSWGNPETTGFRDTCVVTETLLDLEGTKTNLLRAVDYIEATELNVCDYLARKILALNSAGMDVGTLTDILVSYKIDWYKYVYPYYYYYASFGYQKDDLGTPLDTGLVLSALLSANYRGTQTYAGITNFILSTQNYYGYWRFSLFDASGSIYCTSQVILALVQLLDAGIFTNPIIKQTINYGTNWLKTQQQPDGSFGNTIYETAIAALAFLSQPEHKASQNLKDALNYIRNNQQPDGSWNNTAYDTAIALKALTRQRLIVSPISGTIGTIVKVTGTGFGQTETIRVDFGQSPTITTAMTNARGSFTTNFTIDSQQAGMTTVKSTGLNSGLSGTTYFNIIFKPQASITISPTSGYVGSIVTVAGEGYGQTETIAIDFGVTPTIAVTMTDNLGQFKAVFTVDTQAECGTVTVSARGLTSGARVFAYFIIIEEDTIPPIILHTPIIYAPAQLPMIIMATITDNIKVEQASLYWKIGGTKTIGEVQMVNIGTDLYQGTISAAEVTMRGLQYYIFATDGKNGTSSTAWTTYTYGTVTSGRLGAVKPKWKSISVPIHPHNPDPANVLWNWGKFEKNVSLKYFDGTNWIIHNPPASRVPDFAPELGYMISADKNREIIVCGTSTNPVGYHVIKLTGGSPAKRQNHIGQPYLYPVAWDKNVKFKRGNKILNPVEAQKKGWIKKSLSYYAGSGYKKVPYPGVMYPWVGYVLPVILDCEMLIPAEE
ncbi:MAG: terpene cyclase/mutase family protein, partial [bacterium]|nr:terpene cyclase/mutase family protein [bacterium]